MFNESYLWHQKLRRSEWHVFKKFYVPVVVHNHIVKSGHTQQGRQRYLCRELNCLTKTFLIDYQYNACKPGIADQEIDMAINSSGIRDTARVLHINKNTVIRILKKEPSLVQVNPKFLSANEATDLQVPFEREEAEVDEQWSFVGNKSN